MSTSFETKCDHCRTTRLSDVEGGFIKDPGDWKKIRTDPGPTELGVSRRYDLCPSCFTLFKKFVGQE